MRLRQLETISNTPKEIEYLVSGEKNENVKPSPVKDTDIFKIHRNSFKFHLVRFFKKYVPLLNVQSIRKNNDKKFITYTWGKIVTNPNYEYIVELDTPYVLTYYNVSFFKLLKPILRYFLKRKNCKQIICISEAAKRALVVELGEEVTTKVSVVYPVIDTKQNGKKESLSEAVIKLLFVSTQFELKGGRELLEAYKHVRKIHSNVELTLITNLTEEQVKSLPEGVVYQEANVNKALLNEKYYPEHDIFVLPTYQDSFGLVLLEALSHGLPIVSVDRFAIPEIVVDGYNGKTVTPPLKYYNDDCTANQVFWGKDLSQIISSSDIDNNYVKSISGAICNCIENYRLYSINSRQLFEERFNNNIRESSFVKAVKKANVN